mgnify:CR=1 FL=1
MAHESKTVSPSEYKQHIALKQAEIKGLKEVELGDTLVLTVRAKVDLLREEKEDGKSCTYVGMEIASVTHERHSMPEALRSRHDQGAY